MRTVRIWFTKLGRARFISHLDINRCMSRAVRRAKIPLWYTEGFNPHPYMTFSLPLSLGIESLCESMDIRIEGEMGNEEVKERMNAVMPEGIRVVEVAEPVSKAKDIAYASYEITLETTSAEDLCQRLQQALQSGELMAEKKGKQGRRRVIKEVNLSDYIRQYEIKQEEGNVVLQMVLMAGSSKNVNPMLLMETLLKKAEVSASASILRRHLYLASMELFQ